ncbi:hypothetical protein RS9916_33817 [Synechococcus sp. RS9916]|nr:hypothetical protein RS9916_33817 [Synechococcus sp. RS9916]
MPAMSKEQLKAFLEKVKGDLNLQERLKAAKSQDEVVSIAKEHGHDFGAEHISQLSEEELEGVAGGGIIGVDKATRADCRKTSDPESCQF